jgi:hypothetical protein
MFRKYDKQDQQGKAAFNERNPHMTQHRDHLIYVYLENNSISFGYVLFRKVQTIRILRIINFFNYVINVSNQIL